MQPGDLSHSKQLYSFYAINWINVNILKFGTGSGLEPGMNISNLLTFFTYMLSIMKM